MNPSMSMLPAIAALLVTTVALVTDLRTRRIPNWLTGTGLLLGVLLNVGLSGLAGGASALAGAGIGFVMLFPFWLVRGVGAGDVKLLAALGGLVGPQALLLVALCAALVGGVMSLVIMAHRGTLQMALFQMFVMRTMPTPSGAKAPYAVALSAGVYLTVLRTGGWGA